MGLEIKRRDGSLLVVINGVRRLKVMIELNGRAEVQDSMSGETIYVERGADGSIVEVDKPTVH